MRSTIVQPPPARWAGTARAWRPALAALLLLGGCAMRTPDLRLTTTSHDPAFPLFWPDSDGPAPRLEVMTNTELMRLEPRGERDGGKLYTIAWGEWSRARTGDSAHIAIGVNDVKVMDVELDYDSHRRHQTEPVGRARLGDCLYAWGSRSQTVLRGKAEEFELVRLPVDVTLLTMLAPPSGSPRGTVVFLSSLGGMTTGEEAIIEALLEDGWAVLWTSPRLDALQNRRFQVAGEEGLQRAARVVADELDVTFAARVYAVEAALELLHERRPELVERPIVAFGCSAGAINTPALIARMPDRVRAAVIVGGGADVFGILTTSDLLRSRIDLRWAGRSARDDARRRLGAAVLEHASLDPYHTAGALGDRPTLLLHAAFDRIVPAGYGDLLYERLGRPERWVYPLGHLGLFMWLPTQARAIVDWIDQRVPDETSSDAGATEHDVG